MKRVTVATFVIVMLLALLSAGVALAAIIDCPTGPTCEGTDEDDFMDGTAQTDNMFARGGNDVLRAFDGDDNAFAGPGDDVVYGGNDNGSDELHGDDGDDRFGCNVEFASCPDPGEDTFMGGPGKDEIWAREGQTGDQEFADTIDCGEGKEDLAVFAKSASVSDSVKNCERLDWTDDELKSCATSLRPWDNASVKCFIGTKRADRLVGRNDLDVRKVDAMWGKRGKDKLYGRRGFDGIEGGIGDDVIYGGEGDDGLFGDPNNTLNGGSDRIYGGDGDDFIDAEEGMTDGMGSHRRDVVSCGPGDDWAQIDEGVDSVAANCETVDFEEEPFRHWWRKVMRGRR